MSQADEEAEYKKQRNRYDIYSVVLPMLISLGLGLPLIFLDSDPNIIIAVVAIPIILSRFYKILVKKPTKPIQSVEEIVQEEKQQDFSTDNSADKIKIQPEHEYSNLQNIGLWILWFVIGLPMALFTAAIPIEYFTSHQDEVLTKTDILLMGGVGGATIFINWLMYKLIKESKDVERLYKNRVFDGIEFGAKGICFDIMCIDRITQSWMIKNQVSHYALRWTDIAKVSFLPYEKHHKSSTPALLQITLTDTNSSDGTDFKEYIAKYEGIFIMRTHLKGHEKAIIALIKQHAKVEIEIQDIVY